MIADIRLAAEDVGITAVVTNSSEKIESQLNRIVGVENLPIMLVSWDLDTSLTFDSHGRLQNPSTKVVCLLLDKAEDTSKKEMEDTADRMGGLFQSFCQALYNRLVEYQTGDTSSIITDAGYKRVPKHGAGKHSGCLGRFTMSTQIINCKAN